MKWLIPLLAAAALSGCVAYAPGTYAGDPYYSGSYPYPSAGVTYYGSTTYYGGRHLRDRDRDGIPNRYDRDRDGDGVPNRYDRAPNNPRQY